MGLRQSKKRLDIVRAECQTKAGRRQLVRRMDLRWGFCEPPFAEDLVEEAARLVTSNPARWIPIARVAVQVARRSKDLCTHLRAISVLAAAHRALNRFERADAAFRIAFPLSRDCRCCACYLNWQLSYLRTEQRRFDEALAAAEVSYRHAASDFERGRALLAQAYRYHEAGDYTSSSPHLKQAVFLIPPSHRLHDLARQAYGAALALSDEPADIDQAADIIPKLREKFCGLRDLTVERTKLVWLGGLVQVRQSFKPDLEPAQRRKLARAGRRELENARKSLIKLKLELELTAIAVDIAASLLPDKAGANAVITDTLAKGVVSGELAMGLEAVARASRGSTAELADALQTLRDKTVELGAQPAFWAYAWALPGEGPG